MGHPLQEARCHIMRTREQFEGEANMARCGSLLQQPCERAIWMQMPQPQSGPQVIQPQLELRYTTSRTPTHKNCEVIIFE